MKPRNEPGRNPTPLNAERLRDLALRYVGKYATTRARLRQYLARKLRERGWEGAASPDLERLADRFAELGLIDDAAYALAKSRSLSATPSAASTSRKAEKCNGSLLAMTPSKSKMIA